VNPVKKDEGSKADRAADRKDRWWKAPKEDVARQLAAWCDNIERVSWARRWNNLAFYRYMTGRPNAPATYNYATTSRPSSVNVYSRAVFETPRYNVLRQCSDALANRVYKNRPFLQVCPIAGDFKARCKAKHLTRYLDAAFFDLKLWPIIEQCGEDCRIWGTSFLKVDVGLDDTVRVTRILQDEVIIDDNECNTGEPRHLAIRVFVNRDELAAKYQDNPAALDAIRNAPKSSNGFFFGGDLDCTDVIVLREGWSLPMGKVKGRHVLAAGDFAFIDEEYKRDHFPIAKLTFKQVSTGWFGMGMAEMVMGLQREVDRLLAAIWENMRRAAWPRIGIAAGSNVTAGQLADKSNGIYSYTGTAPKFDFPEALSPDQHQYLNDTIQRIKETFRLNDQIAQGQKPKYTSGKAIVEQNTMDDAAHIDIAQHLEDFVENIGYLIIEASEICKPSVTLPGRKIQQIDWADVEIARNSYSLRAFPVGRLSQSIAERTQEIESWYAEGSISRGVKMRLEQVPDVDGYQDLVNASGDYIEQVLDHMIEDGEYEPAEPWCDLQSALETTQSRYLQEKIQHTPQDRLDLLLQFMAQVQEMIADAAPTPAPGGPGFGIQPPGAPPTALNGQPAPQAPFPIAPSMAPPAQQAA
jgi:hypothetical protein